MLSALLSRVRATSSRWAELRDSPQQVRWDALVLLLVGLAMLALDLRMLGLDEPLVHPPGSTAAWQAALLVVATTVLLAKRRHPVLVLVGVAALSLADALLGGTLGMYLVLFDALFTVAVRASLRARRVVLAVLVGLLAAVLVVLVAQRLPARDVVQLTLAAGALLLPPWWWGADVRRTTELAAEQARRADAEAARADLARAHADDVAGHLSAVAIHTEAALAAAPDAERDRAALAAARAGALDALTEMRSMILVLREGADADAATAPARLAQADGLDVDVVGDVPTDLPAAVDLAAFRILQEAVTNAHKHGAGRPSVRFARDEEDLEMVVDNPVAAQAPRVDPALTSSTGLATMRERATALGGSLTSGRTDGTWRVVARLPLRPEGVKH